MSTQEKQNSNKERILELKQQGLGLAEISRELGIPRSTVEHHYYPEAKEKKREYERRPYVKERNRESRYRNMMLIDAFTDSKTRYTFDDLKKKVGGSPSTLTRDIDLYVNSGVLLTSMENGVEFYRLNRDSPFRKLANGSFKREEKRLFGKKDYTG
jgi:DNA-binding transcriptional ArsR family regulator